MTFRDQVLDIEKMLKGAGVPMTTFFAAAGINGSTWTRWRSGSNGPRLCNWQSAYAAAVKLVSDRGRVA